MSPLLITITAFVGVAALVGAVAAFALGGRNEKVEERLGMIIDPDRTRDAAKMKAREAALYESLDAGQGFFESIVKRFRVCTHIDAPGHRAASTPVWRGGNSHRNDNFTLASVAC